MTRIILAALAAGLAVPAPAPAASAHVTLDTREAPALGYVRLAIRLPHGCEGAATTALRVGIPEGVTAVKAQPKPGWTLTLATGPAPASGGHDSSPPVQEITWRGGPLPDAFYEEFLIRVRMPDGVGQTVWFPFVQECEGGKVVRWIEKPSAGQSYDDLRAPAFPVKLVPKP